MIDGTLAIQTVDELALTPRWVELWVRGGSMTQGEADEWGRRSAAWVKFACDIAGPVQ